MLRIRVKVKGEGKLRLRVRVIWGGQGTFWGLYLTGFFGPKTVESAGHCYKNK